jgi:hypothetical protein
MAFKRPTSTAAIPTDPEQLYRPLALINKGPEALWLHQGDVLRAWHRDHPDDGCRDRAADRRGQDAGRWPDRRVPAPRRAGAGRLPVPDAAAGPADRGQAHRVRHPERPAHRQGQHLEWGGSHSLQLSQR